MKLIKRVLWLLVGTLLCIVGFVTDAPTWVEVIYPLIGVVVFKLGIDDLLNRLDKPLGFF